MQRRDERGEALVVAIVVPAILSLIGLIAAAGRIEGAQQAVNNASQVAARAATFVRFPAQTIPAANAAVQQDLAGAHVCSSWHVSISGSLTPGGIITAQLTCAASLSPMPGSVTVSSTSTSVVDPYRGIG